MARDKPSMLIEPVDSENNLFRIVDVFPQQLVDCVMRESWPDLDWQRQEGQENWLRRRIKNQCIPWIDQWDSHLESIWPDIQNNLSVPIAGYSGTAFWLDEPGFQCPIHTDGEMPGSMHLTWHGPGTTFYWYKDANTVRYQVPMQPNAGYIMINLPDHTKYRRLQWHGMLDTVPADTFRLSTYTWIIPKI